MLLGLASNCVKSQLRLAMSPLRFLAQLTAGLCHQIHPAQVCALGANIAHLTKGATNKENCMKTFGLFQSGASKPFETYQGASTAHRGDLLRIT
jgi:hypothetical protein